MTYHGGILALVLVGAAPPGDIPGPGTIVLDHAEVSPGLKQGALGSEPLTLRFLPADWPNVMLKARAPWDWSRYGSLILDLKNPGTEPLAFGVRVDDDPAAD